MINKFFRVAIFLFFLNISAVFSYEYIDLAKHGLEQYQDIIINNKVVSKGKRSCESRYRALKKILDLYKRPITVLDLGASQGYFSFRIAHDYDSTVVMVEGGYPRNLKYSLVGDQLEQLCKLNTDLKNIILLKTRITLDDLTSLAKCEHFDVILAFNVIHHIGPRWMEALEQLFQLGDNLIIETPPADDSIAKTNPYVTLIEYYLMRKNGKIIAETARHTKKSSKGKMFWFQLKKKKIQQKYMFGRVKKAKCNYIINSNFEHKTFYKVYRVDKVLKSLERSWHRGINLVTFKMLNGVWPENNQIVSQVKNLYHLNKNHDDFMPWNFILQGENLKLIDNDEKYQVDSAKGLAYTIKFLNMDASTLSTMRSIS